MELLLRGIVVYILAIVLLRLLGKSLTFQQKPYDFVVMMLIGSASAALIVNKNIPLVNAIIALIGLAGTHALISMASLSNWLGRWIGGQPDLLVRNGRIVKANLIKNQISVDQLLSGVRSKGYRTLADVEFAILEPGGQLSVIPKSQARPITPRDLGIDTAYEGLPVPLVTDRRVEKVNLESIGLDTAWLKRELAARGIPQTDDVLLSLLDTDGTLYIAEQPPGSAVKAFFLGEGKDGRQGDPA